VHSFLIIMKLQLLLGLLSLQAVYVNAYQLPFKLPFGLDSIFGTGDASPELFALHKELINIPSVTGSEHEVGLFLADYLEKRNYTVEKIPSIPLLRKFC